jgi:hypothetical protein
MVLGFNHNLMYKGEVFHVQTEDSGVTAPHFITLLYRGGVIISSKKTGYSDILKMDNLEVVVEELMKEQHKEMMRRLKAGEFDEKAFSLKPQLIENYEISTLAPEVDPIAELFASNSPSGSASKKDVPLPLELPQQQAKSDSVSQTKNSAPSDAVSKTAQLDEAILSFFGSSKK